VPDHSSLSRIHDLRRPPFFRNSSVFAAAQIPEIRRIKGTFSTRGRERHFDETVLIDVRDVTLPRPPV
jgi:hypothetical protein